MEELQNRDAFRIRPRGIIFSQQDALIDSVPFHQFAHRSDRGNLGCVVDDRGRLLHHDRLLLFAASADQQDGRKREDRAAEAIVGFSL